MSTLDKLAQSREEITEAVVAVLAMLKEVSPKDISLDMAVYRNPLEEPTGDLSDGNLELDSLDALELTLALENQFRTGIPDEIDYADFHTVQDVVDFVVRMTEAKNQ